MHRVNKQATGHMAVTLDWMGAKRFVATTADGHRFEIDGRPEWGGDGRAPSNVEYLLAALGGCSGMDVASILTTGRLPLEALRIEVDGTIPAARPTTVEDIAMRYVVTGSGLTPDAVERAIALSHERYCVVGETLRQPTALTRSTEVIDSTGRIGKPARASRRVALDVAPTGPGQLVRSAATAFAAAVDRCRSAIPAEELWLLGEVDPQSLLGRAGYTISGARQMLAFHPDLLVEILETAPAAAIEAPLRFLLLEHSDQTVSIRCLDPVDRLAAYDGLTDLGARLRAKAIAVMNSTLEILS